MQLLFAENGVQNKLESSRKVFVPIRKLSDESNEEMLANKHTCGRQAQDTSTESHTSDYGDVKWLKDSLI